MNNLKEQSQKKVNYNHIIVQMLKPKIIFNHKQVILKINNNN